MRGSPLCSRPVVPPSFTQWGRTKRDGQGFMEAQNLKTGRPPMRAVKLAVVAAASFLVTLPVSAQTLLVEKNLSMGMSLAIIQGAIEQCSKDGYKVSVTVVDRSGNVAAQLRGDGTGPHTMEFSRLKAYTARTRNMTSLQVMKLLEDPANAYIRQVPGVVGAGGGVPIRAGTEVIGGIGVSGAPGGEKDEACANAGLAKVEAALK